MVRIRFSELTASCYELSFRIRQRGRAQLDSTVACWPEFRAC